MFDGGFLMVANPLGIGYPQFKIECQLAIKTELEIPGGPMIVMIGIH